MAVKIEKNTIIGDVLDIAPHGKEILASVVRRNSPHAPSL